MRAAGSTSSAAEAGEEGATKKAPTGPVYAPIATSAPTKKRRRSGFRAFCAAAAEENYGGDEQDAPIAVPERLEGAVTLYPVTNLPVARPAIGDAPPSRSPKPRSAAEENPELLGMLLTSKSISLWIDTRTIDRNSTPPSPPGSPTKQPAKSSWTSKPAQTPARLRLLNSPAPSKTPHCPPTCAASSPPQPVALLRTHGRPRRTLPLDPQGPYAQLVFQPKKGSTLPLQPAWRSRTVENLRYFTQISRIIHELARLLHFEMEEHGQLKVYEEIELPFLRPRRHGTGRHRRL